MLGAAPAGAGQATDAIGAFRDCEAAGQASDWDAAVPRCEAALEAFPENFGIHYFLGFAYQARQEWKKAAAAFEAFLAEAASSTERPEAGGGEDSRFSEEVAVARRGAGVAHFRSGDYAAAAPLLARASEADPTDLEVTFYLGASRLELGDADGADAAFSVVVREAPHITPALYFLGRLRYEAGDHEEARTRLQQYLAADPEGPFRAEAHWMAGSMALRRLGDPGAAADAAERAARHFGAFEKSGEDGGRVATAHYFLATIAEGRDDCEAVRRHYERFLEMAPDHERAPEVREYLAHEATRCEGPDPG